MIVLSLFTLAILFFLGACIGSFLNVVIYRSTRGENWVSGRSHCESCHKKIAWYDNVPLLSFFMLKGTCRHCHAPLSLSHPVIEGLTGLLFIWWYAVGFFFFKLTQQPFTFLQPTFWLLVGIILLIIFIIDYRHMIIPDTGVTVLLGLVIFYRVILVASGIMQLQDLLTAIIATSLTVLFFWGLWYFTKGNGFGFGDVKLAVPLGLLVGWPGVAVWLLTSFVLGSVVGSVLLLFKKAKLGQPIPFGPFLILGTLITLIWGDQMVWWYATLIL